MTSQDVQIVGCWCKHRNTNGYLHKPKHLVSRKCTSMSYNVFSAERHGASDVITWMVQRMERKWQKSHGASFVCSVLKTFFTSFVYIVTFQNLWFPCTVVWILQGTLSDSIAYWSLKRNFYSLTLLHNYRHTISTVLLIFIAVVIL